MKDFGVGIIGCGNISASYLKLSHLFKGIDLRPLVTGQSQRKPSKGPLRSQAVGRGTFVG